MPDEDLFVPTEADDDPDTNATMQQGKTESLADPWFQTDEGKRWLAAHDE